MTEHPELGESKAPEWSDTIEIPATIEGVITSLGELGRLILAREWDRAAQVYAATREGKRGPGAETETVNNDSLLAVPDFAALGIYGLNSHVTVRRYRDVWQWAMDQGAAEEARLGVRVSRPNLDWPKAEAGGAYVEHNGGVSEWFTPTAIVEAARRVMGSIDLDPCSTPVANNGDGEYPGVRASQFYTAEDDGLTLPWSGCVWLNPPYSEPLCGRFTSRLIEFHMSGAVPQAITLTNNSTDARWWQDLALASAAYCFPLHRVKFWHPDKVSAPLQGQSVLYLGTPEGAGKFVPEFSQFGFSL